MKKFLILGLACAAGLFSTAIAAEPNKEVMTAATHAGMAASAPDMKMGQTHMHHVINCLVGPKSPDFDATAGNPCNGQGMGAIPDAGDTQHDAMTAAVTKAKMALADPDMDKLKADALDVKMMLDKMH